MYKFRLPVGDWSRDGHNQCDYYYVESDKPVEDVREAHFNIESIIGCPMGSICSEYEENDFNDEDAIAKIMALGYTFEGQDIEWDYETGNEGNKIGKDFVTSVQFRSKDIANLWIFLLNVADPELNLKIVKNSELPMLAFYGFDHKNRHLDTPGYGCFE